MGSHHVCGFVESRDDGGKGEVDMVRHPTTFMSVTAEKCDTKSEGGKPEA